jgi:hypothetical protein
MIKLTNQRGSLVGPLHTHDAPRHDTLGTALNGIEVSLGVIDRADLAKIRAVLEKYVGGSSTVNGMGIARAGDSASADVGRRAAAVVRANVENNQKVALGYKTFWDQNARDNMAAIRR